MPRRDGTGPNGGASRNGACIDLGLGLGSGYRRGTGRNFIKDPKVVKKQKELLQVQKELLESRLDVISKQLENL